MPAYSSSAPGKVIILGEHAVVYGYPSIAVPVYQVSARAIVAGDVNAPQGQIRVQAPDIGLDSTLAHLPADNPLAHAVQCVLSELDVKKPPSCWLKVSSTIPIAAGLGSGAAISVVIIRSFSAFLGHPLPNDVVSKLAFEVDKIHHGTPSGVDNTVITYEKPVYYVKDDSIQTLELSHPFTLLIGDTGIISPTSRTVREVRQAWIADPQRYEDIFKSIGTIVERARKAIENGEIELLGELMNKNHTLLRKMNVSSPDLDHLVEAARSAGAFGAKLSGGGRGGNMLALVDQEHAGKISNDLIEAGAVKVITTHVNI
jgi:mevalonate kinase